MSNSHQKRRLLAQDCSGSTNGNQKYFDAVNYLYISSKETFTDILLWSNVSMYVTSEKYEKLLSAKRGAGTTNPHVIVQWMIENHFDGEVVLITDGQIPIASVEKLDQSLAESAGKIHVSHIKCVLIQTTTPKIDTTVIAPFIRRYPNEVILYGREDSPIQISTGSQSQKELIDTIRSIQTIQQFQSQSDVLFSNIVTKMMGKELNSELRDEILKLQKRLMFQLRIPPKNFFLKDLLDAFKNNDQEKIFQLACQLNELYKEEHQNMTWPSLIFHLLRMTSGSLHNVYSVHALATAFQADRIRRADVIEHFEATDTEATNTEANFVCPITYEEESDVVLLIKKPMKPILMGIEKNFLKEILTCPLNLLKSIELTQILIDNIDQPISLTALKEANDAGHPIEKSPLTRAPVLGALCLGPAEDHVKATNWVIMRLMIGGKDVGNLDQWFALFWYLIEINRLPFLNPILPKVRQHMIFRLKNHLGSASLTAIPYCCQTALPLGACCWFALNIDSERFVSAHPSEIPIIVRMCELSGLTIDEAKKKELLILSVEKRARFNLERDLPLLMRASYNTLEQYPGIAVDGPVNEKVRQDALKKLPVTFLDIPVSVLKLAVNHLLGGQRVDDIGEVNWGYGLEPCHMPPIEICPATLRPYLLVPPKLIPWRDVATKVFCPESQLINCHAQYLNFVTKFKKFPSKIELAQFCMKMIVPKKNVTLPVQIGQFLDCVVDGYNDAITKAEVTPKEFIEITNQSLYIKKRARIEHKYYTKHGVVCPESKYDIFINNRQRRK
ncbi:hypothetical protein M9Y10_000504 [Tritrichomonas musculus]|uniref:Uncharacterized protein n=1 Tax=Tritrichomonas musculus TaxID=1915356 RepID=A0ABR2L4E1_9EUKA